MTAPTLASLLEHLVMEPTSQPFNSYADWKQDFIAHDNQQLPWVKAIQKGFHSSCMGYVFSVGYQSALQALSPSHPANKLAALCVTEEKGNHPKVIETQITHDNGAVILNGAKKFISGGVHADILLVAAKTNELVDGRPVIKLLKVDQHADGVNVKAMPTLPFVPEVDHAAVSFENVKCTDDSLLAGDGYADYVKPFRTIEDTYVSLAVCAYLLKVCLITDAPKPLIESAFNLISQHQQLTQQEANSHVTHLLLAGARTELERYLPTLEQHWANSGSGGYEEWLRDKALLKVAKEARTKRTETAWQKLNN